jgi:hypothetical protein
VGERENQRQRDMMREALAGFVEEDIEAATWARRHRGWEDSWRKGPEWISRRLARGDHPADHTGSFNILVVTPTRVMVFNAKPAAPMMKVRRKIAEWPRGGVRIASKGHTVTSHYNQGNSSSSHRIVRATFTWSGEERPLILDFPPGALTKETLETARR